MMANVILRRSVTPIVQAIAYPLALSFVVLIVTAAEGAVLHEYSFNSGTANDTAVGGTAHGTLNGNAKIVAGSLVLDGSPGTTMDLPGAAIAINTYPAVTVEVWATPSSAMTGFTSLFGFGAVNTADPTLAANYFILQTHRGDNVSRAALSISNDATPFSEEDFANGPEYNDNLKHHYAAVLDTVITASNPTTSIKLYTDGALRQSTTYPVNGASNAISGISTQFARIGSAYPVDPLFIGTVGNIRISNVAETAGSILIRFAQGEPGPAGPRLTIDRTTGTMTLSNAQTASNVVGYSITSAAGSLNPASWSSITDNRDANSGTAGNFFDSDDNWTKLSAAGSKTDYSEFEFDGGNGGAFGTGGTLSLPIGGAGAWRKSIYEDVLVEMRLADGTDVPVQLLYTGGINNMPYIRSDLTLNGTIDVNDWNIFLANSGKSFINMSAAETYALGDLNGDLMNNRVDFRLFKADYNVANGSGSFEALTGVPEPSTLALLALACAPIATRRARRGRWIACSAFAIAVMASFVGQADAALKHRYSFNEGATADASNRTIIDSMPAAKHGIIRGAGSSATANRLNLAGGASATAAYVDLPNGLVSALSDATFEAWYTMTADPVPLNPPDANPPSAYNWSRVFDFGSSTAAMNGNGSPTVNGELTGPGGTGTAVDQLFYAPTARAARESTTCGNWQSGSIVFGRFRGYGKRLSRLRSGIPSRIWAENSRGHSDRRRWRRCRSRDVVALYQRRPRR